MPTGSEEESGYTEQRKSHCPGLHFKSIGSEKVLKLSSEDWKKYLSLEIEDDPTRHTDVSLRKKFSVPCHLGPAPDRDEWARWKARMSLHDLKREGL